MATPAPLVTITYYLEVLSSWCHWAEPAWCELKQRYAGRVAFGWKIAAMDTADFPQTAAQCDWFYRRSGTVMGSDYMLNSGWIDSTGAGDYRVPNLVAEAARDMLADREDDRVRLALAAAALREGQKIGADFALAAKIAAKAAKLDAQALRRRATSAAIRERVAASTAEFRSHQIGQRPAFILKSAIGDQAVFSGLARIEPLVTTIDAMCLDAQRYASFAAHFGAPPQK